MTGRTSTSRPTEVARGLQLEVCVHRLLGHLFHVDNQDRPNRHRVLTEVVGRSPTLRRALLADDRAAVLKAWSSCLRERGADLRFLHTLAVIYREHALVDGADDDGALLVFATALWALLLSTSVFWARTSERVVEYRTELVDSMAKELFGLHATAGRRALADGRTDAARSHLSCLDAARSGTKALVRVLDSFGLPYPHEIDARLWDQVSAVAATALDSWVADVVRAAQKVQTDPDAIARLPAGISSNWAGGIEHLRPFVRLGVPVALVLRTGLQWYVDWSYALYHQQELDRIRELSTSADRFARQLMPLSVEGHGHQPENQALSRYFMFRGLVAEKAAERKHEYDTALKWNPNNDNAAELRQGAQARELIAAGYAALRDEQHSTALAKLREALQLVDKPDRQAEIQEHMAVVHNAAGVAIVARAQAARDAFGEALEQVLQSVKAKMTGLPDPGGSGRGRLKPQAKADDESALSAFEKMYFVLPPPRGGCAVCEEDGTRNRTIVVTAVYDGMTATGMFQADSAVEFWGEYEHLMCHACRSALNSIHKAASEAREQFREAIRMDPKHPNAKDNLAMVDKMEER